MTDTRGEWHETGHTTEVSASGPWRVHDGTEVTPDGMFPITVISDGVHEFTTRADVVPLIVALMQYRGIAKIEPDEAL